MNVFVCMCMYMFLLCEHIFVGTLHGPLWHRKEKGLQQNGYIPRLKMEIHGNLSVIRNASSTEALLHACCPRVVGSVMSFLILLSLHKSTMLQSIIRTQTLANKLAIYLHMCTAVQGSKPVEKQVGVSIMKTRWACSVCQVMVRI